MLQFLSLALFAILFQNIEFKLKTCSNVEWVYKNGFQILTLKMELFYFKMNKLSGKRNTKTLLEIVLDTFSCLLRQPHLNYKLAKG